MYIKEFKVSEYNLDSIISSNSLIIKNNGIEFYIKKIVRNNDDYVLNGDVILVIEVKNLYSNIVFSEAKIELPIKSDTTGYLKMNKKNGDQIFDNDKIFHIHDEIPKGNEITEKYNYFNEGREIEIVSWYKSEGDFVNKGDELYIYKLKDKYGLNFESVEKIHISKEKGFLSKEFNKIDRNIKKFSIVYSLYLDDKERILKKYLNKFTLINDDFDNKKLVKTISISCDSYHFLDGIYFKDFILSLIYNDGDYIYVNIKKSIILNNKNCKLSFLFSKGSRVDLEVYDTEATLEKNDEIFKTFKSRLSEKNINLFKDDLVIKYKIYNENIEVLGLLSENNKFYESSNNLKIILQKYFIDHFDFVKENIANYSPEKFVDVNRDEIIKSEDSCYVYLMKDLNNSYHKIGISNNPTYREKTLQSEKPSIELIASKKYPIRKIAEAFEKSLHQTFSNKNIRGEWFKLDESEVRYIIESLR